MTPKELRKKIINMSLENGGCHIAPAFSCADIMISIFYNNMKKDDKFILSKGHACLVLYTILRDKGYNPCISCGHPDIDIKNGIECTTGSLGHGLPIAVGMAIAKKLKNEDGRIYIVMGDSELQEGTTWESLLVASRFKLDNLIIIIDRNRIQALDYIENVLPLGNIRKKFKSFNCDCISVENGNSVKSIDFALKMKPISKPLVVIANTIKGKGVSFMENKPEWHARNLNQEELKQAYEELEE